MKVSWTVGSPEGEGYFWLAFATSTLTMMVRLCRITPTGLILDLLAHSEDITGFAEITHYANVELPDAPGS